MTGAPANLRTFKVVSLAFASQRGRLRPRPRLLGVPSLDLNPKYLRQLIKNPPLLLPRPL